MGLFLIYLIFKLMELNRGFEGRYIQSGGIAFNLCSCIDKHFEFIRDVLKDR